MTNAIARLVRGKLWVARRIVLPRNSLRKETLKHRSQMKRGTSIEHILNYLNAVIRARENAFYIILKMKRKLFKIAYLFLNY